MIEFQEPQGITLWVASFQENRGRIYFSPAVFRTDFEAIGYATMEIDKRMREAGLKDYRSFPPWAEEGSVNLSAYGGQENGYPKKLEIDAYIHPLHIPGSLAEDYEKGVIA